MEFKVENATVEGELWTSFRNGDPKALSSIFEEYYDSLFYYGMKLVQDEDLVKDCVQNLFLKLWTRRESLGAVKIIKPYLFKSLRRHISDEIVAANRKKKNLNDHLAVDFDITFSHEDFLIASQMSEEQSKSLVRALNQLSKRQREAVFLKFYESLDYEKISEVMALNVQSVRNLIYQSLKCLKSQLTTHVGGVVIELAVSA